MRVTKTFFAMLACSVSLAAMLLLLNPEIMDILSEKSYLSVLIFLKYCDKLAVDYSLMRGMIDRGVREANIDTTP